MSSGIKVALGILGGALLALVVVMAFSGWGFLGQGPMMGQGGIMGGQGEGPGNMMGGSWGASWAMLGMLVPLLFWVGLLVLIGWAVVRIVSVLEHRGGTPPHTHGTAQSGSAEEILKERFARGEIDAKEFEERRRVLRGEDM